MAFLCTDTFDSYSNGANLGNNTAAGGSGWTSNWGVSLTGPATATNAQSQTSPNSALVTANQIDRTFTAVSVGTLYFSFFKTNDDIVFYLRSGGTNYIILRINLGNLQYYDGTSYNTIQAINNNQWYRIGIDVDETNQAGKARYNVDNGTFTSWFLRADGGTATSCDRVLVWGTGNVYVDSISPVYAVASQGAFISLL